MINPNEMRSSKNKPFRHSKTHLNSKVKTQKSQECRLIDTLKEIEIISIFYR